MSSHLRLRSYCFQFLPRSAEIALGRRLIEVGVLTLVGVVGYLLLGPWLLALLFEGRYDEMAALIPILCLAGVAKALYSVPSSLLGGRLARAALREFSIWNVVLLAVAIGVSAYLGLRFGALGVAWGTVIAWVGRLGLASWLVVKYWRSSEELPG